MIDEADRAWVQEMAETYDRCVVPTTFRPFAVDLARRVAARRPRHVLEVAAGTGAVTAELVRGLPRARIVATDFNMSMVDYGRRRVAAATWRQADAMALPFDDGEFDVVVSQFGAMFFPDKQVAFGEARRVLLPGGALLFNTWAELESHEFEAVLVDALRIAFPVDPPMFLAAVPHGYADPDVVAADVRAAGFDRVSVERVTVEGHAPSVSFLAGGYCRGTPLRAALEARGDLDATTTAVTAQMVEMLGGDGAVTVRMAALVVEALAG